MPDVSDTWIKLNYWFLTYRKDLTRWWVMLLIGFDVFLIVLVVANGILLLTGYAKTNSLVAEIASSRVLTIDAQQRNSPKSLDIHPVQVSGLVDNKNLYVAFVSNNNLLWSVASLDYAFEGSGGASESRTTFLLPNENRILFFSGALGDSARLVVGIPQWKRTPKSQLPEVTVTYTPGSHSMVTVRNQGSVKLVSQVATTATNTSLYSIKSARGVAIIKNGDTVVGAQQFFLDNMKSKESRDITIQFAEALPSFTSIEFSSEINTLDPTIVGL
jgi:hypothetical protein